MSDAPELKPCPFCGARAYEQEPGLATCDGDDECAMCGVLVEVTAWNARHCPANSDGLTGIEQRANDEARHAHRELAMAALLEQPGGSV